MMQILHGASQVQFVEGRWKAESMLATWQAEQKRINWFEMRWGSWFYCLFTLECLDFQGSAQRKVANLETDCRVPLKTEMERIEELRMTGRQLHLGTPLINAGETSTSGD
jgi:hypothetical protein